ncbi:hypothetical protein D8S78_21240 [Natrialba swarupiae]|nr:hypothetical protein [Natrialba swarupiae]
MDDDYTFTFRRNNASHQEVTGLSEDELRGQTPRELLGDKQGATVAANYRRCAEQGRRSSMKRRSNSQLEGVTGRRNSPRSPMASK